jgi:hypothetical protein
MSVVRELTDQRSITTSDELFRIEVCAPPSCRCNAYSLEFLMTHVSICNPPSQSVVHRRPTFASHTYFYIY